ncbi:MAG: hypothetical protein EAZ89_20980 [Bacteroidetes bacterium]|nr:MAG: hypothetical protein EAZ89_20980 [Bacteroidota bacterium]
MKRFTPVLRDGTAIFLGLIFFSSGMGKLYADHAFPGIIGPVWLEELLSKHGLGLFGRFIAWSQVLIGFLLLTLRFRTAGAVMLVPMVANIFVVTLALEMPGTPYVLVFLMLLNLCLLWFDRHLLLPLIGGPVLPLPVARRPFREEGHLVWIIGLELISASVVLSLYALPVAWTVCSLGLCMAWGARWVDAST